MRGQHQSFGGIWGGTVQESLSGLGIEQLLGNNHISWPHPFFDKPK